MVSLTYIAAGKGGYLARISTYKVILLFAGAANAILTYIKLLYSSSLYIGTLFKELSARAGAY